MTIRAYVVDDEPLAIERLKMLLLETGRVNIIGSASVPEQAIEELSRSQVDVCFLDIEMPRRNGFQLISALPNPPAVVFTTAYDRYALKAFEVNSVDYLLKPVDREHLTRALDKLESRNFDPQNLQRLLEKLMSSMRGAPAEYLERIGSRLGDRVCFVDVHRVTHFFARDKLTYAVSEGKHYIIDSSIQELEARLDPKQFLRIHRGAIANVNWIKDVSSLPGGSLNVRLKDEAKTELTVARDRARDFKQKLGI